MTATFEFAGRLKGVVVTTCDAVNCLLLRSAATRVLGSLSAVAVVSL